MKLKLDQAKDFLTDHFGSEVTDFERLLGGEWSHAFGFSFDGSDLVARFGDYVDDFEKDRAAAFFASPDLPIPRVLEIGPALGGHFCISERMVGEMIDRLDSTRLKQLVPSVLQSLDALRNADFNLWIAQVGAPTASWPDQLLSVDHENERLFGWHDRMASSPTGTEPYDTALKYVQDRIQICPNTWHLLHNDLLHFNVLVKGDRISGIFDWGCAGGGDFLYELALFTFYAPWYPAMADIDWRTEAINHYRETRLTVPAFEARLRLYEIHIGLSGMAYNAFTGNMNELETTARRTLERLEAT